jgi:hypothetical protein
MSLARSLFASGAKRVRVTKRPSASHTCCSGVPTDGFFGAVARNVVSWSGVEAKWSHRHVAA